MPAARYLTHNGVTLSLEDWAKKLRISKNSLHSRLSRGWTVERIMSMPMRGKGRVYTFKGRTQTLKEWAKELGVRYNYLALRLRRGMTVDEAFNVEGKIIRERVTELVPFVCGDGLTTDTAVSEKNGSLFSDRELSKLAEIKARRKQCA